MKKKFNLTSPTKAPARQVDAVKHEIKKYIARERRKTLAPNADFWDFDCKFGDEENTAKTILVNEINKAIDASAAEARESFYIEIIAKPGIKIKSK